MKILKTMTNVELETQLQKCFFSITERQDIAVNINYDEVCIKFWGRSGEAVQTFNIKLPFSDEEYLFHTFEDFALFITAGVVRILVN